ncbi:4-hydroxy-tetrahydrodipicolinate synthase [Domibacillus antri]|uniref:4-hydroxy-tetrahydrodipicolinate synthase n=1 Tax=Domibacillus antri TaxID=1714264 RepID=A0A1Q8Q1Z6_9BACI|nr:4-hydroxy-tetrahydrodipicolinate synthase [Domibacillus antri]OLN21338.1 4-hydroxy-tetrahydrodipicolinate synthase [Domibacillus antri]
MDFGRLITAMITPLNDKLEIDYEKTNHLIEHLIKTGTDTLVICGTTGEPSTLSKEEKLSLFKFVVDQVRGRCKVIAGTGTNNTKSSIEMTKEAEKLGVDGILLVVPYYNKPSQEGLFQHFKAISNSTDLPIFLYNIPGRTAVNLSLDTIIRLSQINNIISIKEASGDLSKIALILEKAPLGFKVYSGDDSLALPILSIGGHGVISVASHVVGSEMKTMITTFLMGKVKEAADMHRKLIPIFDGLFITTNPAPVKFALEMKGIPVGSVRLPLVPVNNSEAEFITSLFEDFHRKS